MNEYVGSIYWNHNTAYHSWLLKQVKGSGRVLDVGCVDGLLVSRLSKVCDHVIGIDIHTPSIERAKRRLFNTGNASIIAESFENFQGEPDSFDAIIFVASLHHMNAKFCFRKSKELLKSNGKLLVVGLTRPQSVSDWMLNAVRILPIKFSDFCHHIRGDVGAPIRDPDETLEDIKKIANDELPNAKIRQALYYRYLLTWIKPCERYAEQCPKAPSLRELAARSAD